MAFRQKLTSDIKTFFKESKWEDLLHDQLVELLEMRPTSPYEYIQKKISLRSRLDNTKNSSFLTQLLIYLLYVNPMLASQSEIENKILYLCVDKYQHTKIRKNDAINMINGLLLLASYQQKQKQYFMKLVSQEIEVQTINVCNFAHLLYSTILFMAMKKQIDELDEKLSEINLHINLQIFQDYLEAVGAQHSILKKKQINIDSDADLYKVIAVAALNTKENA